MKEVTILEKHCELQGKKNTDRKKIYIKKGIPHSVLHSLVLETKTNHGTKGLPS